MRRTTSPTRYPYDTAWYPCAVPGSHCGACSARAATMGSHARNSEVVRRAVDHRQTRLVREQVADG